ncbi:hypothetical protein QZH41_007917 [Actinostola sp. cb2023]|nr:hypothetical protein QZH41_007917 [Actinostola sp. cb2023]
MAEHLALVDIAHNKVQELSCEAYAKELRINELKAIIAKNKIHNDIPELALRIAALMKNKGNDDSILSSLLSDMLTNLNRKTGSRWSEDTKSFFAIILDYGGPALAKIVSEKLGAGPSIDTMYRSARYRGGIPNKLDKNMFERASNFYKNIGYTGPFALLIDATAVTPLLKVRGNKVIGLASETDVILRNANDIINIVNDNSCKKAKQANAFILTPLRDNVPPYILAISPVYKGQDYTLVRHWFNQVMLWSGQQSMMVVGLGADGDSKVRKYYMEQFKRKEAITNDLDIVDDFFSYNFVLEDLSHMGVPNVIPTMMFPDWRHLIKKWRNQLLNVKRILVLGNGVVQIEHLIKVLHNDRMRCGLWKSDVFVKDKQNVDAAIRVLQQQVRSCMSEWNELDTKSTRCYLKMGQYMLKAYTEKQLSVQQRTVYAWAPIMFLRYWKFWLVASNYDIKYHFISLQTHEDFILSGHSIIMSMKMFSVFFPGSPFQPWTFGSNSCEELFSRLRGFTRGKSDLCLMDMVDMAGRVQKLYHLKFKDKNVHPCEKEKWPVDTDGEIARGMAIAEKEVIKTIEYLGMLPKLIAANILRQEGDDIVLLNNPSVETFPTWLDTPDETKIISVDELLELDNGILLEAIDQATSSHTSALINLAAEASLQNEESEDDEDEEEDDDSATQCSFYVHQKCQYQNPCLSRLEERIGLVAHTPLVNCGTMNNV